MNDVKTDAIRWLESERDHLQQVANSLWQTPELPLQEQHAAAELTAWLDAAGFEVTRGVSGIETAFVAERSVGSGGPTVGFIAEYDALPDLSNEVTTTPDPVEPGEPGHGCGHNLIGTGNTAAAIATSEAMATNDLPGTVRVYGSPAEELLISNVFMARDGLFEDDDAVLTSHPHGAPPTASAESSLALISTEFQFEGTTCHIPSAPEEGRNALDAALSLIHSTNQLEKHLHPEATLEYVVPDGGKQPNTVPASASVWFFIRHPEASVAQRTHERVQQAAQGAATATGTTHTERVVTGCRPYQLNTTLAETLYDNAVELGPLSFSASQREFAATVLDSYGIDADEPISGDPTLETDGYRPGSQDDGDVSWLVPMGRFLFPYPTDIPLHTWGATAVSGSDIGIDGMLYSARVLACTALDVVSDATLLANVREEFETATSEFTYDPLVPDGTEPVSPEWVERRIG